MTTDRALLVDLYELTMAAGYYEHNVDCRATFELFARHLPPQRSYLVASGLESALSYLESLRFTAADVRFLRQHPAFHSVSPEFFDYLREFRFHGDVHAVPEGTLVFADEPLLQVTARVLEAQIAETYLLSAIHYETLVASKAARVVCAAAGRSVLEFGTRRAHGPEAGVRAARAACVGGCNATSNVLAGALYDLPLAGTAAHSWTQVFSSERRSFEALLETYPDNAILLVDTYDALAGTQIAATLGRPVPGVRLDSGDLLEKSREVRKILDRHGLHATKIVVSGDLNEYRIAELIAHGAPIDSFGVGTDLATSRDVPALSVVYKLVETEANGQVEPKAKFSEEKISWPGRKQVYRFFQDGKYHHDVLASAHEEYAGAEPLLELFMVQGRRTSSAPSVQQITERTLANLSRLPEAYKALSGAPAYPVEKSAALEQLLEDVRVERFGAVISSHHEGGKSGMPGASELLVFFDIDTQVDFMEPTGKLYVPGAEQIVPNVRRLMNWAHEHQVPVISSADAHTPNDPEFQKWPPHCVAGTPGQQRIPETQTASPLVIPCRADSFSPPHSWSGQFIVEKQTYSVQDNPNFPAIVQSLDGRRAVVFGVATECCVRAAALALCREGFPVDVVTDAIRPMSSEGGRKALEDMAAAGARMVTTAEVCGPAENSEESR